MKDLSQKDMIALLPIVKNWIIDPYFNDHTPNHSKKLDMLDGNLSRLLTFRITESNYTSLNNIFKSKIATIKYIIKIFKKMYKLFNDLIWLPRCQRVKEWEVNRIRDIHDNNFEDNDNLIHIPVYNHHVIRINDRDVPQDRFNRSSLDRKSKIEWSTLKVIKNITALIEVIDWSHGYG